MTPPVLAHRIGGAAVLRRLSTPARPRIRGHALAGAIAIATFLGTLAAWSALAPLAAAVVANGQLKVERSRRVVQNLEGGVIREIRVREGSVVAEGDVLVRLHDEQTGASAELLAAVHDSHRALRARLIAETGSADVIDFPEDLVARRTQARIADMLAQQDAIFRQRRTSLDGQASILTRRIQQLEAEIRAHEAITTAQDTQLRLLQEEEATVRQLVAQGHERKPRLLALQRHGASLQGNRDEQIGLIARARQAIAETELQGAQLRTNFGREVALELRDVESRIVETEEKLRAAADVQRRREILAPTGGIVMNLRFNTLGGVVRPGEPILEIVPARERLIVDVGVQPHDIDSVGIGHTADVRLLAFKQRIVPSIRGLVVHVSADTLEGERGAPATYRVHVLIDAEQAQQVERVAGVALQPGMPAEVLIESGRRTVAAYLLEPLRDSFRRGLREP